MRLSTTFQVTAEELRRRRDGASKTSRTATWGAIVGLLFVMAGVSLDWAMMWIVFAGFMTFSSVVLSYSATNEAVMAELAISQLDLIHDLRTEMTYEIGEQIRAAQPKTYDYD